MLLKIQSDDDSRLSTPRCFSIVKKASLVSGIPVTLIRSMRNNQEKPPTRLTIGDSYNITWLTPRPAKTHCISCSSLLTLEDNSNKFNITSDPHFSEWFKTMYAAAKHTGLNYQGLKDACISGNTTTPQSLTEL